MKIDPEFQKLIPPLSPEELAQLEANLLADGCRDPLVTWNGVLLDGHNRMAICQRHGMTFKTVEIVFKDRDHAKLWIIDCQKGRRNIHALDKISLERHREEILAKIGRGNQRKAGGAVPAKLPKAVKVDTRKSCAASAGVGDRTYDAGKVVLDAAEKGEIGPEVVEDIRRNRNSIHAVAKQVKETRQKQARQTKRKRAAAGAVLDTGIIVGDFRKHTDKIPDGTVNLIFTDPPYDKKASAMLPALAEFAARKLCDGGSLLCYVGQTQIPAAIDALRQGLRYWWTIACIHAGGHTVMREYGIKAGWKAVLWFVKGTRDDNSVMVSDVMSGGQEKDAHDWQQSESEAAYWIGKLCPADGLVCDPFLGGGTTAVAAKKLGRKWTGFEVDEEAARVASGRLK